MGDVVGTQMDGLRIVGAGMQPPPQPSPVRGEAATGEGAGGSPAGAALPAGGEPAKTEASPTSAAGSSAQPFDPNAFLAQIQGVLDERDRRLQSSLDKRDGHIRKMLAERQGQVNAIGEKAKTLGMQEQQVQALQSALMNDALAEAMKDPTPDPSPQTPTLPSPAEAGEVAQAEARAEAMAELAGLTMDDPEAKLITGYTSPAEYLAKVKEACAAKMRRTLGVAAPALTSPAGAGEGLRPSPQPSPNGRGSSVGAAAVMGPGGSAAEMLPPLARAEAGSLWRKALAEEAARRSG